MRVRDIISAIAAILLINLLCFSVSQAAIQGELSAESSSGVTTISLNIEPNIQISNISDITLDVATRDQDVSYEERVCVRGNVGSRYSVTAAGLNGSQSAFQLRTEADDTIDYEVYFRGNLTQINTDRLYAGQASPFYSMQSQVQDCNGDDTAAFTIIFRSDDLEIAEPGAYSGFLTLTVAAE